MLLQNDCINNSVTNGLKERKKACKTAKERIETGGRGRGGGEQLIGTHTQNIGTLPLNCNNTTQGKKKARNALTDEGKDT